MNSITVSLAGVAALFPLTFALSVSASDTAATLALCPKAQSMSDALYSQTSYTEDGSQQMLTIQPAGELPAACESTPVRFEGSILWAAPTGGVDEAVRQLGLIGEFSAEEVSVSDIVQLTAADLIDPPTQKAPPAEQAPELAADGTATDSGTRGAWLWAPDLWMETPELIWQTATAQRLTEIYVSVPVEEGQVLAADRLAEFISAASQRELVVWVVLGDPHDVLPESLPAMEDRVTALLNYQRSAPQGARLGGIQLDIEPYLLPGFGRGQAHWRSRYLSVIQRIYDMLAGELMLDLVMPVWWGSHPAWGAQLFAELPADNLRLTVMNYRTTAERLASDAKPFLDWGKRATVPIVMALEAGPLPDETHRRYRRHEDTGELWLLPLGSTHAYVLFDQPQTGLSGIAFAAAFEYPVPADQFTFAGDLRRMDEVLSELLPAWREWPSFAGIAIHGLDAYPDEADTTERR